MAGIQRFTGQPVNTRGASEGQDVENKDAKGRQDKSRTASRQRIQKKGVTDDDRES